MSHFIGLLFGGDESVLNQYDENIEVEPYIKYTKEEAIEEAKYRQKQNYIYVSKCLGENPLSWNDWMTKIIKRGLNPSDEEAWQIAKEWGYDKDENDNLLTTYNPDSKWDWYQVGGRWGGYLPLKGIQKVSFRGDDYEFTYTDECTVGEVDWDKYFEEHDSPFCFITEDGEWHETAEMGPWAITTNDKKESDWNKEFKDYLNTLDSDTEILVIDFHI